MLLPSLHNSLNDLVDLLQQLPDCDYSRPCSELSNASIGEHTRHIIEMFQCLENKYDSGVINYDLRERNKRLETESGFAIKALSDIQSNIDKPNKQLILQQSVDSEEIRIESNYFRELLYNLEHCIHHQALIKVALFQNKSVAVNDYFGVARATIEYRNQCAQ